jgi:hypothetical protein
VERKKLYLTWIIPPLFKVNRNISVDARRYYYRKKEFFSIGSDHWLLKESIYNIIPLKFVRDMDACAKIPRALHLHLKRNTAAEKRSRALDTPRQPTFKGHYQAILPASSLPLLVDFINTWSYSDPTKVCGRGPYYIHDLPGLVPGTFSRTSVTSLHILSPRRSRYFDGCSNVPKHLLSHLKGLQRLVSYHTSFQTPVESRRIKFTFGGFSATAIDNFLTSLEPTTWDSQKCADEAVRIASEGIDLAESGDYLGSRGKLMVTAYMCGVNGGLDSIGNIRGMHRQLPRELVNVLLEIWTVSAKVSNKLGRPKEVKRISDVTCRISRSITPGYDPEPIAHAFEVLVEYITCRLNCSVLRIAKSALQFGMAQYPGASELEGLYEQYRSIWSSTRNEIHQLEKVKAKKK